MTRRMTRRLAAYLDALAQVGARVVIALDAGARRLDPPTPGDPRP